MGVKLQDADRPAGGERPEDRIRNGMVAADGDGPDAGGLDFLEKSLDPLQ